MLSLQGQLEFADIGQSDPQHRWRIQCFPAQAVEMGIKQGPVGTCHLQTELLLLACGMLHHVHEQAMPEVSVLGGDKLGETTIDQLGPVNTEQCRPVRLISLIRPSRLMVM